MSRARWPYGSNADFRLLLLCHKPCRKIVASSRSCSSSDVLQTRCPTFAEDETLLYKNPEVALQSPESHLGEERFQLPDGCATAFQNVTKCLRLPGCQFVTTTDNYLSNGQFTPILHLCELSRETSREVLNT